MQHFFVPPSQVGKEEIVILGSDVNHMKKALRMRPGEQVTVSNGNNCRYLCRIRHYSEDGREAVLGILEILEQDRELASRIVLFQGLPKKDKMEFIVQKAVELGVARIVPVSARRSVVWLTPERAGKKIRRWQEIAKSAAKQSGRGIVPAVSEVVDFAKALEQARKLDVVLIPYELAEDMARTKQMLGKIRPGQSVGVFIGPEGGFEKEEVEAALREGACEITLGRRILRTETAGLAILSVLMFQLEKEGA